MTHAKKQNTQIPFFSIKDIYVAKHLKQNSMPGYRKCLPYIELHENFAMSKHSHARFGEFQKSTVNMISTLCLLCQILTHPRPPGAAYRRQWIGSALVRIMACRLFGANPLSKPMLGYCIVNWTLRSKLQWNYNQNAKLFVRENAYENVACDMVTIFSRGKWVKEA